MKKKIIKIFHPNSKKLSHTVQHIWAGPCIKAAAKVLGIKEEELAPVEQAFDTMESVPGVEVISLKLGNRRMRVEQVLQ